MEYKTQNYDVEFNNIYHDNCQNLIKLMIKQKKEVDLILTDPPYNISKDNNFKTLGRNGIDFGEWDKNFNQISWLKNINKIVSKNGSIIIFNDWKNMGEIAKQLEKEGFIIKDLIRWIKPAPMPRNTSRRYVTDYEFALWATKDKGKWIFNKGEETSYLRPMFQFSSPGINRIHPTEKPRKLIEEIIKIHSNQGDIIFDPFSGSGAISLATNNLDRYYLASEINKNYFNKSIKRINQSYLKPAFNHLGNKYRMIDDLLRLFPKKGIDYFVDVFAGSGVVSLSYKSPKKIFLNDKDLWLSKILEFLFNTNKDIILKDVEDIIKKYNLPTQKQEYKNEYNKLKKDFNKDKNVSKLLVLVLFGFNQQIRFNSKDQFNIPVGKFFWNNYHKQKLINFIDNSKNKKSVIRNQNFDEFIDGVLKEVNKENSVFYFDPPYLVTNATYNKEWNIENEKLLLKKLQYLTDNGYKWFLSNVEESKGISNEYLKEFIKKNKKKIEIHEINKVSYRNSNYQRKNADSKDKEILIKGFL